MKIIDILEKYDREQAKIVLSYILDVSFGAILSDLDRNLSQDQVYQIESTFKKMEEGIPVQYALGKWDFYGRTYLVNPSVLIPRRETEELCQLILTKDLQGKKILDIGTGSGAIAITIFLESMEQDIDIQMYASDIMQDAIDVAEANAEKLGAKITFINSDLFENIKEKFDVIVSNPPYISQKDYDELDELLYYEPESALLAGEKGYEIYERIISQASDYLNEGGMMFFEIGYDQGEKVRDMLSKQGFNDIKIHKDYGGNDRMVEAVLS